MTTTKKNSEMTLTFVNTKYKKDSDMTLRLEVKIVKEDNNNKTQK